jgi:hypothetical protein
MLFLLKHHAHDVLLVPLWLTGCVCSFPVGRLRDYLQERRAVCDCDTGLTEAYRGHVRGRRVVFYINVLHRSLPPAHMPQNPSFRPSYLLAPPLPREIERGVHLTLHSPPLVVRHARDGRSDASGPAAAVRRVVVVDTPHWGLQRHRQHGYCTAADSCSSQRQHASGRSGSHDSQTVQ